MRVEKVPQNMVWAAWKHARYLLDPAIDMSNGRWSREYVLAALPTGSQTLWVMLDDDSKMIGAATTEIVNYPETRALTVHFLGGEGFDEFFPFFFSKIENEARETGCSMVESNARHGFWKWFKEVGAEKVSTFYEKKL